MHATSWSRAHPASEAVQAGSGTTGTIQRRSWSALAWNHAATRTPRLPLPRTTTLVGTLVRPPSLHHRRQRPQNEPDVLPQRPVRDVEVVELEHLLERDPRATEDLPEAGEPR